MYELKDEIVMFKNLFKKTLKSGIDEKELIGKVILVGMTYYTKDDVFVEQKQFWGTITSVCGNTIFIEKGNGEEFSIPNDKTAIEKAKPGEYRLHSTGEVVVSPDFLSTWTVNLPD